MARSGRVTTLRSLAGALRLAMRPGGPSLAARASALPRLIRATLKGEYPGTSVSNLLLLVGAVGYVLSPIDLLPEAILGPIGLADDAFVVSWLVKNLVAETEDFLAWERSAGTGPAASADATDGSTVRSHVIR